jgi:hypothetical protein
VNEEGHALGKGDSRRKDDDDDDDRRDSRRKDAKSRKDDDDDDDDDRRDSRKKDSKRADSDETSGGSKNPMDDSRSDSVTVPRADWEKVNRTIAQLTAHFQMPDENQAQFADVQSRADDVNRSLGRQNVSTRWLPGEDLVAYRKRLVTPLRQYSKRWADVKMSDISGKTFDNAEYDIYNDAMAASHDPGNFGDGELRRIVHTDPDTGQRTITYGGRTSFIKGFAAPGRRARFNRFGPDGRVIT